MFEIVDRQTTDYGRRTEARVSGIVLGLPLLRNLVNVYMSSSNLNDSVYT